MHEGNTDVLTYIQSPPQYRGKLHSTTPIKRLNEVMKRSADVVGVLSNKSSIRPQMDAFMFEQRNEWQNQSRCTQVDTFDQIDKKQIEPVLSITANAV